MKALLPERLRRWLRLGVRRALLADFAEVVATNLNGTFHLIHSLLPGMKRRGRG